MEDTFLSLSNDLKRKVLKHIRDGIGDKLTKDDISKVNTAITNHIVRGGSDGLLIDHDDDTDDAFEYTLAGNLLRELQEELERDPTEDEFCSFVGILETVVRKEV